MNIIETMYGIGESIDMLSLICMFPAAKLNILAKQKKATTILIA